VADYSKMTDQDFDKILEELVGEMSAAQILAYGDVNMVLREELNNEVLSLWEKRNPNKALPPNGALLKGIRCQNCLSTGPFKIEVKGMVTVEDEGNEPLEDIRWDDDSFIKCFECDMEGHIVNFKEGD